MLGCCSSRSTRDSITRSFSDICWFGPSLGVLMITPSARALSNIGLLFVLLLLLLLLLRPPSSVGMFMLDGILRARKHWHIAPCIFRFFFFLRGLFDFFCVCTCA